MMMMIIIMMMIVIITIIIKYFFFMLRNVKKLMGEYNNKIFFLMIRHREIYYGRIYATK